MKTPEQELRELRERNAELEDRVVKLNDAVETSLRYVERGELPPARVLARALGFYNRWTPELIVERVQEWAEKYGEPPKAYEWTPSSRQAADEDREKFYSGDWPGFSSVRTHFPKWNDAIAAAGFGVRTGPDARPGGGTSVAKWPVWTGWQLIQPHRKELGLTQAALAHAANCSVGQIQYLETGRGTKDMESPNPSVRLLLSLSRALAVPTILLVAHTQDEPPEESAK